MAADHKPAAPAQATAPAEAKKPSAAPVPASSLGPTQNSELKARYVDVPVAELVSVTVVGGRSLGVLRRKNG